MAGVLLAALAQEGGRRLVLAVTQRCEAFGERGQPRNRGTRGKNRAGLVPALLQQAQVGQRRRIRALVKIVGLLPKISDRAQRDAEDTRGGAQFQLRAVGGQVHTGVAVEAAQK